MSLTHDARYAIRLLGRRPGAVAAAVLTLALGIAATTTLFSVAYGVLLKPLSWPDSDRLAVITETRGGRAPRWGPALTNATYIAWREQATTLEAIAAWSPQSMTLTGAGDAERVRVVRSTASLGRVLGARPAIGRLFEDADEPASQPPTVVISSAMWRQRFGANPGIVGQTLHLNARAHTILGVLPVDFQLPDREAQAWVPFRVEPVTGNALSMFSALAKLRPGVTAAQAAAEGTARGRFVPDTHLTTVAIFGGAGAVEVSAVPLLDSLTSEIQPALAVFLVAVALLFATAVANVASLQLARATTRRREIAIRSALGAGNVRLARQLVVENLLIGLAGGAAGLLLAWLFHRAMPTILPADFPRIDDVSVSSTVAFFAMTLSVATSLAVSLLPLSHARRWNLVESLADGGAAPNTVGTRTPTGRVRLALMVGQVAIACVLLLGASLLGRSFVALLTVDRGFDPSQLLTARMSLPSAAYPPERRAALFDAVLERIGSAPGVTSAGLTSHLPLSSDALSSYAFKLPRAGGGTAADVQTMFIVVSPGYMTAMGMRVTGRSVAAQDSATSRPVVVVNRAFARAYLDDTPIGELLPISPKEKPPSEVIGVVDDVRMPAAAQPARPEIFVAAAQTRSGAGGSLVVRTGGDPAALLPILKSIVREQDPMLTLESIATMEERVRLSVQRPELYATLLASFAAFALVITGVGVFALLSFAVSTRSREIGVRSALGATRADILALVLRQGLGVTLAGVVIGLSGGYVLARSLGTLMFGVSAADPLSFAIVPMVLIGVALVACAVPARRAASVNPVDVLRQ